MFAAPLLGYRLRWYAVSTARLLLRRWQAGALIIGLAGAAGTSLFGNLEMMAHPLLAVLAPGHGAAWRFVYLLALQAAAAFWAGMQRAQIEGGAFMAFACSLPFSRRQRRHVDLAVLLLADSPLLVVAGVALTVALAHRAPPAHLMLLGDVVLLALTIQRAVLERRPRAWGAAVGALGMLAVGFDTPAIAVLALLTGIAATVALWRGPRPAAAGPRLRIAAPAWWTRSRLPAALAGRHAPALQVSLAILLRERRTEALGKAFTAGAMALAALFFVEVFERDGRSFPTILIAQGLVALTVSGLFRGMYLTHRASADVVGALPLARGWARAFDLAAVLAFGLLFLGALAAVAWIVDAAPAVSIAAAVLSYALLLCALRVPQLYNERHAVVLSAMLAGGWTAATVACLTS